MTRDLVFAVPEDLATPTGGYAYDRRMIAELSRIGWSATVVELGEGFPRPSPHSRAAALRRLRELPPGRPIVIDGLAMGALPELKTLRRSHVLVGLVHHPLAFESGLSAAEAEALRISERTALSAARRVVTTSNTTKRIVMDAYEVPASRITVALPGSDPAPTARGSGETAFVMLSVGAVTSRKGYDVLVAALARLAYLPWRLLIAGDVTRDPVVSTRLAEDVARLGFEARIELLGAVSAQRLQTLYDGADLFVLASRFEGYGMAIAEAIARGLPVVATRAGAIPEVAGAGLLVPPDDPVALADALRTMVTDAGVRARAASASAAAARGLPRWRTSAEAFASALQAAMVSSPMP